VNGRPRTADPCCSQRSLARLPYPAMGKVYSQTQRPQVTAPVSSLKPCFFSRLARAFPSFVASNTHWKRPALTILARSDLIKRFEEGSLLRSGDNSCGSSTNHKCPLEFGKVAGRYSASGEICGRKRLGAGCRCAIRCLPKAVAAIVLEKADDFRLLQPVYNLWLYATTAATGDRRCRNGHG